MRLVHHYGHLRQIRLRWLWITWPPLVVWFNLGGRKPLARLPRWRRRLFHLPCVRVRLWPQPGRKYIRP